MQPRLELSYPVQPRHLYRHLVREASYLPGICRPFVDHKLRGGFERAKVAFVKTLKSAPKTRKGRAQATADVQKKAIQDGLKQLRDLRAINLGDSTRLSRLLGNVFAKHGKRRRELVSEMVLPDAPVTSADLQTALDSKKAANTERPLDKKGRPLPYRTPDGWATEKLLTYLDSQRQQQNKTDAASWNRIGLLAPYNPTRERNKLLPTSIWGKPISDARIRNLMQKWWKSSVSKLAPPLSKTEWERLAAAQNGSLPENMWKPLQRRPIAQGAEPETASSSWDWAPLASFSASRLGRANLRRQWRLTGKQETGPYAFRQPPAEQFRDRALLRSYERLWQTTAYVELDPETLKQKTVHWGADRKRSLQVASAAQARIFENAEPPKKRKGGSQKQQGGNEASPPTTSP